MALLRKFHGTNVLAHDQNLFRCDRSEIWSGKSHGAPQKIKSPLTGAFYFGARGSNLEELLGWAKIYPIQWRDPRVNLTELAKLRWIEGWDRKKLAAHFGRTEGAVQNYFQEIRRKGFNLLGLSENELRRVKSNARSTR